MVTRQKTVAEMVHQHLESGTGGSVSIGNVVIQRHGNRVAVRPNDQAQQSPEQAGSAGTDRSPLQSPRSGQEARREH